MRSLILPFVALIFTSCQTPQLVPSDYSVNAPDVTALSLDVNGREIYVEHMTDDANQIIFDLEIVNQSGRTIEFDPGKIRLYMSNMPFPQMETDNQYALAASHVEQYDGNAALRPRTAQEVDKFLKGRIRSQRAMQVAFVLLGTAMLVNDAVQDAKDASKEVITQQDLQRAAMRDVTTASALAALDFAGFTLEGNVQQRYADLEYLPEEYFSRQVLQHGKNARGKIFFKFHQPHLYYRILIPMDGYGYVFDFRRPKSKERKMLRQTRSLY